MGRALRVVVYAMAAVIVGGTVASAVPGARRSPADQPSPSFAPSPTPSVTPDASPTPELSPQPPVTPEPTPVESPAPLEQHASDPQGTEAEGSQKENGASGSEHGGPDFSVCDGLTGLQNAICRHEVLLQLQPNNPGLQNALAHLRENLGRHQANGSGKGAHGNRHGDETGDGTD
ncbi:MAG: hypothetical protein ACJ76P_04315 [Actinomycetota bacterium]